MNNKSENKKGFSLIELLVAMGIFSLILLASINVMIVVIRAQGAITRIQAIQDNARFSLELITKEIRTGSNYNTALNICTADGSEIHFDATSGKRVYYLDPGGSGKIYRAIVDVTGSAQCGLGGVFNEFTGDQVVIEHLAFILRGQIPHTSGADGQPMAIITMRVKLGFTLETTIVQRIRDIP